MNGVAHSPTEFKRRNVHVFKFRVANCDVFQTLYFPYGNLFYRATLTGEELLLESAEEDFPLVFDASFHEVLRGFGLQRSDVERISEHNQSLGKIEPLPAERRKALLLALSVEHGIFSLGRYACWRNLLLDDVFEDYFRVKRLMELDSVYDFRRAVK
jgi:hypothetical protein